MSSHTAAQAPADPITSPFSWFWGLVLDAVAVFVTAVLLGGLLYYVWPVVAGAFSFLDPINGYWNNVLLGLGLYAIYSIYSAVREDTRYRVTDVFGDSDARAAFFALISKPGVMLIVAMIIVEYIA